MDRLEILAQIDTVHDSNCPSCPFYNSQQHNACTDCPVYAELGKLGDKLLGLGDVNKVLAKGEDITFSDVDYLLKNKVTIAEIAKAIGMNINKFREVRKMREGETI